MDAPHEQRLQNARFQNGIVVPQLESLKYRMDARIQNYSLRHPLAFQTSWVSLGFFGLDDIKSTYDLAQREKFDIKNYTHLWIVYEYIDISHGRGPMMTYWPWWAMDVPRK